MKPSARTNLLTATLLALGTTVWGADQDPTLKVAFKEHFLVGTAVNRGMVRRVAFLVTVDEPASAKLQVEPEA